MAATAAVNGARQEDPAGAPAVRAVTAPPPNALIITASRRWRRVLPCKHLKGGRGGRREQRGKRKEEAPASVPTSVPRGGRGGRGQAPTAGGNDGRGGERVGRGRPLPPPWGRAVPHQRRPTAVRPRRHPRQRRHGPRPGRATRPCLRRPHPRWGRLERDARDKRLGVNAHDIDGRQTGRARVRDEEGAWKGSFTAAATTAAAATDVPPAHGARRHRGGRRPIQHRHQVGKGRKQTTTTTTTASDASAAVAGTAAAAGACITASAAITISAIPSIATPCSQCSHARASPHPLHWRGRHDPRRGRIALPAVGSLRRGFPPSRIVWPGPSAAGSRRRRRGRWRTWRQVHGVGHGRRSRGEGGAARGGGGGRARGKGRNGSGWSPVAAGPPVTGGEGEQGRQRRAVAAPPWRWSPSCGRDASEPGASAGHRVGEGGVARGVPSGYLVGKRRRRPSQWAVAGGSASTGKGGWGGGWL